MSKIIPYGKHYIDEDDIKSVVDVLKYKNLTQGDEIEKFEQAIAKYVGSKYAIAMSSWTAGLHLANMALGIKEGDRVITSPITFAATSNSVIYCGAEPVFSDIDSNTVNISPKKLEETIKNNTQKAISKFGESIPISKHPEIRSEEACYKSSSMAVDLAKKYNTRLHVFHISTEKELALFKNNVTIDKKRITCEVCIHHLWFEKSDYIKKGALIKWNPAVKNKSDRDALLNALIENKIDVIATDHAPHTIKEKNNTYLNCPSGGPLVQHALNAMLELVKQEKITIEKVVEKMSHHPAICFQIEKRGFIRKNYFADLVLVDRNASWEVNKSNLLYKCKWSPFEGQRFNSKVTHTFVNGHLVYQYGSFDESKQGKRLLFNRN